MLAGMNALCTANPFIHVKVGDGIAQDKRQIKEVNDRDNAKMGDLNPEFLRSFELDVEFPKDSKLEISIYDK